MGTEPVKTSGWLWGSEDGARTSFLQGFGSIKHSTSDFSASAFVSRLFPASTGAKGFAALPGLSQKDIRELQSLSQEKDPEMFFAGLLAFGERLQAAGKIGIAAEIYGALVDVGTKAPPYKESVARGFSPGGFNPGALYPAFINPLSAKAQKNLDALAGHGSIGPRAEVLIGDLSKTATDYRMIVPMLAGTMVGQIAGAGIMGRLAGTTRATWLGRGMGARWAAKLGGFSLEVTTFAGLSHLLSGGEGSFDQRLQGAGITLGAMKLAGWGAHGLARRSAVLSGHPAKMNLVQQAGMFGGLLGAHRLEVAVGLRSEVEGATTATDTLASLIALNVGASLGHRFLGNSWLRLQQGLQTQSQGTGYRNSSLPNNFLDPFGGKSELALASGRQFAVRGREFPDLSKEISAPLLMATKGSGSNSADLTPDRSFQYLSQPLIRDLRAKLIGAGYRNFAIAFGPNPEKQALVMLYYPIGAKIKKLPADGWIKLYGDADFEVSTAIRKYMGESKGTTDEAIREDARRLYNRTWGNILFDRHQKGHIINVMVNASAAENHLKQAVASLFNGSSLYSLDSLEFSFSQLGERLGISDAMASRIVMGEILSQWKEGQGPGLIFSPVYHTDISPFKETLNLSEAAFGSGKVFEFRVTGQRKPRAILVNRN